MNEEIQEAAKDYAANVQHIDQTEADGETIIYNMRFMAFLAGCRWYQQRMLDQLRGEPDSE
jgi:hypothetical protein